MSKLIDVITQRIKAYTFLKDTEKTSSTWVNRLEIYANRINHQKELILHEEEMRIFQHSPLSEIEVSSEQISEKSSFAFVRV